MTTRIDQSSGLAIAPASAPAPTWLRGGAVAFLVGAAATTAAGLVVQLVVVPTTDVSDDHWSWPWASGPFVVVSAAYLLLHLLVAWGLAAFGRSGVAGGSRGARIGTALAVAGTLTLAGGEAASLPMGDALVDDASAQALGAVFGVGVLLSAVGFLVLGRATLRAGRWRDWRRFTPLATGIWTMVMLPLTGLVPKALPGSVAVYGACLSAMAIALRGELRRS